MNKAVHSQLLCWCTVAVQPSWSTVPLPHPTPPPLWLAKQPAYLDECMRAMQCDKMRREKKLGIIRTAAGNDCRIVHQQVPVRSQTNSMSIKVVIPINCDAMPLQPAKQGKNETLRREREGEREKERGSATLPCGCALPHIADAAFESLGGVSEGADATVPVAIVGGLFGLSFWPCELDKKC